MVADDFVKPNGIAFSPDEKILYIADTGASHDPDGPRHIRAFDVTDKGKLKKSRGLRHLRRRPVRRLPPRHRRPRLVLAPATACTASPPTATCSARSWCPRWSATSASAGVKKNRLYICGTTSLYAVLTHVNGAQVP